MRQIVTGSLVGLIWLCCGSEAFATPSASTLSLSSAIPASGIVITVVQHDVAPTLLTARRGRARPKRHPARVEREVIVVEEDIETDEDEEDITEDEYAEDEYEEEDISVEGRIGKRPRLREREDREQERRRARGRHRR